MRTHPAPNTCRTCTEHRGERLSHKTGNCLVMSRKQRVPWVLVNPSRGDNDGADDGI